LINKSIVLHAISLTPALPGTYPAIKGGLIPMPEPKYRIIVDLSQRMLYLLEKDIVIRGFPVGIGTVLNRSPEGEYTIINRQANPGGPFGAFWLGLSKPHYGIHGTNNPSSIGKRVSQGCIRMYNADVLKLASMVSNGTRVTIRQ
jgi:hypothetical protein